MRAGFASAQAPEHDAGLAREHQRLFVGPAALPAPPWGSVYLDEESVLFGDSTRALQAFAGRHGIALETGQREPLDHFGLVCWLVAHAAEAGDEAAVHELLCEHLLPWSGRFLSLFEEASAGTPFYQAAAGLARLTLDALQTGWPVSVAARRLYRCPGSPLLPPHARPQRK
ncbi:molecular chaperone TorD family protein, partial [Laribacter hongkongensis]